MATDVCISLISTNTCDLLRQCLASIFDRPPKASIEVWVVDNACTDGTADMVRRRFPAVNLISNDKREGYGANHNKVMSCASARYYLILNEDTVLRPDTIDTMLEFMDSTPDAGVSACKVFYGDGRLQNNAGRFPTFWGELMYFGGNIVKEGKKWYHRYKFMEDWGYDERRVVDWVSGCFFFVRKEVIMKIGGFHRDIFIYYEDSEFCHRMIRETSYRTYFVPDTSITHYHGQSFDSKKFDRTRYAFDGSSVYIKSAYGGMAALIYAGVCKSSWAVFHLALFFAAHAGAARSERVRTKIQFYRHMLSGKG